MKSVEQRVAPSSDYYVWEPSKTARKTFLYPLLCGEFTYEPGYRLSRSAHDSYLIMYIPWGGMTLEYGGKTRQVGEGRFVLLDCHAPHGYSTEAGYGCLWLHFDGSAAPAYYDLITARLGNVFSLNDAIPALRSMNALLAVFREKQPVREALLSKYITDLLTEFALQPPGDALRGGDIAQQAIAFIGGHFTENVTVRQLAALTKVSPYHFIRVFRQETGYTPHDYIVSRRMASARYLLKYTELTVKEICFHCGFSSESVFCGAFKKQHGLTPSAYRLSGDAPPEK